MNTHPNIDIQHFCPPICSDEIVSLLWHKGPPWVDDIRRRLDGKLHGAKDHFWLASHNGQLVAHTWYTVAVTNQQLGVVGHVYTDPGYRRQGISAKLLKAAMQHFVENGGTVMQLFTSTPYTVPFYLAHGFENLYENQSYHETDWYMRYPHGSASVIQAWYQTGPFAARPLSAGDLPAYCLLYNMDFRTRLKDRAQEIGLGLEAEFAFIRVWEELSQNRARCSVLANDRVIAAACSLMPFGFPHQAHVALTDLYVPPPFTQHAGDLLQHCLAGRDELGIEKVIAVTADEAKSQMLRKLGFRPTAKLPGHYRIRNERFDCELLSLD
jgi:N-acetylglutamate synthase-like GNAT family acetyltransferase